MIFRKFAYADDLALLHTSGNWKDLEGTLIQDMCTLSAYLQIWRLKLSHTKLVTAAFHLNNQEAKRELKAYNNDKLLPFCPTPIYFVIKLSGIQPSELRRMGATLSLVHGGSLDPDYIVYCLLIGPSGTRQV